MSPSWNEEPPIVVKFHHTIIPFAIVHAIVGKLDTFSDT
jgi:hypothetical protein